MITIWNRKELFIANTLQKFNEVRNCLIEKRIDYTYWTRPADSSGSIGINVDYAANNASGRARFGSAGVDLDYANIYYIYVHKRDYAEASAAIKGRV